MVNLKDRIKELDVQFNKLEEQRKELVQQGSELQRKINDIQVEQVRIQGAHRELKNMEQEETKKGGK